LNWLLAANAQASEHDRLFRNGAEEAQMLLMSRTVSAQRAYALFGMLLGALPPAAIFARLLGYGANGSMRMMMSDAALFILCLLMNVVSCLGGYLLGSALSRGAFKLERSSWTRMLLVMPLIGAVWGIATGAMGGVFFFGGGAIIGAAFALPIGMIGFLLFAILHRMLERGGMIETRHFLPLACGITSIIAALILGL
jgi:hypothetical protein